jgi:1-acyl-sn-glycerol-3-phosphate acyltransferase
MKYITTVWIWGWAFLVMVLHDVVYFLFKVVSKKPIVFCGRLWQVLLTIMFPLAGIRVTVKGVSHIPKEGPYIIASTHQSVLDIPLLFSIVPPGFAFYAKKELIKVPVVGWNLREMECFLIDRRNPRQALKDLEQSRVKVMNGRSLLIFPEGTRSVDGHVGVFKRGAFSVAVQTGTSVIPCVIDGAYKLINKGAWWARPGRVTITFGAPIPVQKVDKSQEKAASLHVMNATKEAVDRIKNM